MHEKPALGTDDQETTGERPLTAIPNHGFTSVRLIVHTSILTCFALIVMEFGCFLQIVAFSKEVTYALGMGVLRFRQGR